MEPDQSKRIVFRTIAQVSLLLGFAGIGALAASWNSRYGSSALLAGSSMLVVVASLFALISFRMGRRPVADEGLLVLKPQITVFVFAVFAGVCLIMSGISGMTGGLYVSFGCLASAVPLLIVFAVWSDVDRVTVV
jgi:hypothetical protein